MVAAATEDERPESGDVIRLLTTGLIHDRWDELRAAAVVADVRLPELGTDPIRLTIEHAEGSVWRSWFRSGFGGSAVPSSTPVR